MIHLADTPVPMCGGRAPPPQSSETAAALERFASTRRVVPPCAPPFARRLPAGWENSIALAVAALTMRRRGPARRLIGLLAPEKAARERLSVLAASSRTPTAPGRRVAGEAAPREAAVLLGCCRGQPPRAAAALAAADAGRRLWPSVVEALGDASAAPRPPRSVAGRGRGSVCLDAPGASSRAGGGVLTGRRRALRGPGVALDYPGQVVRPSARIARSHATRRRPTPRVGAVRRQLGGAGRRPDGQGPATCHPRILAVLRRPRRGWRNRQAILLCCPLHDPSRSCARARDWRTPRRRSARTPWRSWTSRSRPSSSRACSRCWRMRAPTSRARAGDRKRRRRGSG